MEIQMLSFAPLILATTSPVPPINTQTLADEATATAVDNGVSDAARIELPSPQFGNVEADATATSSDQEEPAPILSGGADIASDYCLSDAVCPTKGIVVQPWLSIAPLEGLSFNTWASIGLQPEKNRLQGLPNGNELDAGFTIEHPIGGGVTGTLTVNHYFLFDGVPDMEEVTIGAAKDGLSVSASYFPWSGGMQDGFRLTVNYDFQLVPKLSASVAGVYETGMEAPDTFVAEAGLTYTPNDHVSINVKGYLPHRDDGVHERRVMVGVGFKF
jgi:hypothetical protein